MISDPPPVRIVHTSPGRLRLRVADRRHDIGYFKTVAARLAACPGVISVEANALSGSVLIRHETVDQAILERGLAQGIFKVDARPSAAVHRAPSERWLSAVIAVNRRFVDASEGRGDIGTLIAAMFIILAAIQAARGQIAMPAIGALWYALNALAMGRDWPRD